MEQKRRRGTRAAGLVDPMDPDPFEPRKIVEVMRCPGPVRQGIKAVFRRAKEIHRLDACENKHRSLYEQM